MPAAVYGENLFGGPLWYNEDGRANMTQGDGRHDAEVADAWDGEELPPHP